MLLALTFLTCGLGLVQKDWCRDDALGARPGVYTHACYSDIPPLYFGRGLADGEVPYIGQTPDRQVEYPVLTGAVMWLTAQLVPSSDDADRPVPLVLRHQRARGSRSRAAVAVGATHGARRAGGRGTRRCSRGAPVLALTGDDQLGPVRRRAARARACSRGRGRDRWPPAC